MKLHHKLMSLAVLLALAGCETTTTGQTAATSASTSSAQTASSSKLEGFLCCNIRYNLQDDWFSDINFIWPGVPAQVVAPGAVAKVIDYGRYRAIVTLDGKRMRLGNDYSRTLSNELFAARWIVKDDPKKKIATFPKEVQDAIAQMKLRKGMTREQVFMSVGQPIASQNLDLGASALKFYVSDDDKYEVVFEGDTVKDVQGSTSTLAQVMAK
jgi:hypothetical protein